PTLPHHFAVAHDDRTDHRVGVSGSATALRELERLLEMVHSSARASIRRRNAGGKSPRPKIDEPATKSDAPASRTLRMLSGPIPPSTCTGTFDGNTERTVRMRSYA